MNLLASYVLAVILLWQSFAPCTACAQAVPPAASAPADSGLEPGDSAYEQAINEGLAAFRAADYARARTLFERAHALRPSARTLRALGLTAIEQKRYTQGKQELEAALTDPRTPLTDAQRAELDGMLTWMRSALSRLHIQVDPAQARMLLDGEPAPSIVTVEPGTHRLHVEAEGYDSLDRLVEAEAGLQHSVQVVLQRTVPAPGPNIARVDPTAAASPSPVFVQPTSAVDSGSESKAITERWWFWTAVGAVVVGGTIAAIALSSGSDEAPRPPGTNVDREALHLGR